MRIAVSKECIVPLMWWHFFCNALIYSTQSLCIISCFGPVVTKLTLSNYTTICNGFFPEILRGCSQDHWPHFGRMRLGLGRRYIKYNFLIMSNHQVVICHMIQFKRAFLEEVVFTNHTHLIHNFYYINGATPPLPLHP